MWNLNFESLKHKIGIHYFFEVKPLCQSSVNHLIDNLHTIEIYNLPKNLVMLMNKYIFAKSIVFSITSWQRSQSDNNFPLINIYNRKWQVVSLLQLNCANTIWFDLTIWTLFHMMEKAQINNQAKIWFSDLKLFLLVLVNILGIEFKFYFIFGLLGSQVPKGLVFIC